MQIEELEKENSSLEKYLSQSENEKIKYREDLSNANDLLILKEKSIASLSDKMKKLIEDLNFKQEQLIYDDKVITNLTGALEKYKSKLRKIAGTNGGLIRQNKRLKLLVDDLTKNLEEAKNGKYVLKKLPAAKRPKSEFIRLKGQSFQSKIVKQMHCEDTNE